MGTHKLSILRREGALRKTSICGFDLRPADFRFLILYAHHVEPPLARRWNPTSTLERDCGSHLVLARICVVISGGGCAQWEGWPMLPVPPKGCPMPSRFSTDGTSYGVRLENRNRCATFTNPQPRNRETWGPRQGSVKGTSPPMTIASPELQPPWPPLFSVLQV